MSCPLFDKQVERHVQSNVTVTKYILEACLQVECQVLREKELRSTTTRGGIRVSSRALKDSRAKSSTYLSGQKWSRRTYLQLISRKSTRELKSKLTRKNSGRLISTIMKGHPKSETAITLEPPLKYAVYLKNLETLNLPSPGLIIKLWESWTRGIWARWSLSRPNLKKF